ncbi:MAG: hypothetical protein SGPRY_002879, partial [Prymnesium sp.]
MIVEKLREIENEGSLDEAGWEEFQQELELTDSALDLAKVGVGAIHYGLLHLPLSSLFSPSPLPTPLPLGCQAASKNCGTTDTKRHQLVHVFSLDSTQGTMPLHTVSHNVEFAYPSLPSLSSHILSRGFETVILNAVVSFYKLREEKRRLEMEKMKRHKQLLPLVPLQRAPHRNARDRHPKYPERCKVPDDKVAWSTHFPGYFPTYFEHPELERNTRDPPKGGRWADPVDKETGGELPSVGRPLHVKGCEGACAVRIGAPTELLEEVRLRKTFEGRLNIDAVMGAPLNPRGRTGMTGRGLLGLWGPNHAADPIVTRWNPRDPNRLQMVAVQRKDINEWAIPGGMVDAGEQSLIDQLFKQGEIVYQGYVDDPRNTDNAWIETTAFHFHCSEELGELLNLKAGDDAAKVIWLETDPQREPRYASLYASHRKMVDRVAETMHQHVRARRSTSHYPARAEVPQRGVSWRKPFPEYAPPDFTHRKIVSISRDSPGPGHADPTDMEHVDAVSGERFAAELEQRETFEGPILMEQVSSQAEARAVIITLGLPVEREYR